MTMTMTMTITTIATQPLVYGPGGSYDVVQLGPNFEIAEYTRGTSLEQYLKETISGLLFYVWFIVLEKRYS